MEPRASAPERSRFQLAEFVVDARTGELDRNGVRVRLPPKPFEVLLALAERPGELVSRETLQRRLWADDTFVDFDNNLNSAVATLREALGDSAAAPRFVETLPKRGYRLLVLPDPSIDMAARSGPESRAEASDEQRRPPRLWKLVALGLLLPLVAGDSGPRESVTPDGAVASPAPAAREAYLRGRYLLEHDRTGSAGAALAELERAVALAPGYALAWAEIARARQSSGRAPRETVGAARAAARRAIELDPALAEGHLRLGLIALYYDYDWERAERELRAAHDLQPGSSEIEQALAGFYAAMGRHAEAGRAMARARELDPISVTIAADAGWYHFVARDFAATLVACDEALALEPGHGGAHFYRLLAYQALHDGANARREAAAYWESLRDDSPASFAWTPLETNGASLADIARRLALRRLALASTQYVSPSLFALDRLALGDPQGALDALERSYEERSGWLLPFLAVYPPLDPLRAEPRFRALERKLALPAAATSG